MLGKRPEMGTTPSDPKRRGGRTPGKKAKPIKPLTAREKAMIAMAEAVAAEHIRRDALNKAGNKAGAKAADNVAKGFMKAIRHMGRLK